MKVIDRYIWHSISSAFIGTLAVLLILVTFIEVADEMGDVGKGSYQAIDVFIYVFFTIPQILYELFPMAVLLGSLIGLGGLAAGSELTAMRSAGISIQRITVSTLKAGAVLVVISTLIGEVIAPYTQRHAETIRAEKISSHLALKTQNGYWLRDNDSYINIRYILPDGSLKNLSIHEYHPDGSLKQTTQADSARYQGESWLLQNVRQTQFGKDQIIHQILPTLVWESTLKPDLLEVVVVRPRMLSSPDLYRYIKFMEDNNQDATTYEVAFWSKVFTPITLVAMILLTIPVVFGVMRNVAMGQRVFIGTLIGIGFFLLNRVFNNMAIVYGIPPLLAASMPSLLVLAVTLVLSRRLH